MVHYPPLVLITHFMGDKIEGYYFDDDAKKEAKASNIILRQYFPLYGIQCSNYVKEVYDILCHGISKTV